jgi:hypothetical protein
LLDAQRSVCEEQPVKLTRRIGGKHENVRALRFKVARQRRQIEVALVKRTVIVPKRRDLSRMKLRLGPAGPSKEQAKVHFSGKAKALAF